MEEEHEEIEVIDVSMTNEEIDQVIAHLVELKEHKKNVQFPIAADVDLSVTFDNSEIKENLEDDEELDEESEVENEKSNEVNENG